MDFTNSRCRGVGLHKFFTIAAKEDAVLERCVKGCGKKNVVKLVNGVPHTNSYGRAHMREFLVPQHRLFTREYPKHA